MGSFITRSFRSAQFDHWLHSPVKFLVLLVGLVLINSILFLTIGVPKTFAYYYNYVVGNNSGACSGSIGGNNLIAVPITPSQDGVVNTVYVNTNNWYFNDNYVVGVYDSSFHVLAKTSSVIPSTTNGYRPYYIPITSINLSGGQTYYIVLNMSVGSLCYPWPGTGGNYKIIGGYNYSDPLPDDLSSLSFTDVTDGPNFDVALYDEIYPTLTPKIDPPSITPIPNNSVPSCQSNIGGNNLIAVTVTPSQNGTVSSIYVYTSNWYYTDNYVVGVYDASFHVLAKTSYTVPIQNSIGSTYIPITPFTVTNGATYWIVVNQSTGSLCYPWPGTGGNYKILDSYTYSDPLPDSFPELNFRDVLDGANFDVDLYYQTNTPPSVASISNATVNEGDTYSSTGSFTDPDSTSWTGRVDYGDATGEHDFASPNESLDQTNHTFTISHVYKDNQASNAPYTVTVKITDNQGATGTATAQVTVNNAAPTVNQITASVNPIQVNTSTTASATFTDPGVLDTHTASWNWGDGNTTTGTVTETNGSGSVSDSHTYTSAGVYPITLTVTDKDGGQGTQTFQYLSVYNPTPSGTFAGEHRYDSPAGAYAQNTSLTGPVAFGFVYKYNGTVPVDKQQFIMDFKAANLHFNATTISALVIANGIGTLTGTGTINGSGTYNFLVTGSESANAIRIQIKDSANNVIYDTQPGAADNATPTTTVTAGNVLAH